MTYFGQFHVNVLNISLNLGVYKLLVLFLDGFEKLTADKTYL